MHPLAVRRVLIRKGSCSNKIPLGKAWLPRATNELGTEFIAEPPDYRISVFLDLTVVGNDQHEFSGTSNPSALSRTPPSEMSITKQSRARVPTLSLIFAGR